MSSSVVSSAIRASWRSSFSSSAETRAPPSRLTLRRRARRSRSRSSWSVAILREDPQKTPDVRPQLVPRDDGVDVAEAVVRLGETEVVRELLARRLLNDARSGERHERVRLRDDDVAEAGEAREDARGGRMGQNADQRAARILQILDCDDGLR